jgi:hypothetical protein
MHWTRLAVPSFIQAAWLVQALLDARVVSPGPPRLGAREAAQEPGRALGLGTPLQRRRRDQGAGAL